MVAARFKTGLLLVALVCLVQAALTGFAALPASAQESARETDQGQSSYVIGPGDRIQILVYGEDDMTVETNVTEGGTISYPFLGELKISGMTVGELEAYITRGLKGPYLVDPKVSAMVVEYRQFYVNGEVSKPGGYPFQPGLTLRKAVAIAGGFTERASTRKVYVIREGDPEQKKTRIKLDQPVYPGDIITVGQSFF